MFVTSTPIYACAFNLEEKSFCYRILPSGLSTGTRKKSDFVLYSGYHGKRSN